jgi:glycosyltransferase involved in cell wall biosynthesis
MKPKLSVTLITYNHGRYVEQALRGILMQKVDFQYEIVIGDDCSPDDTREIIDRVLKEADLVGITVKRLYQPVNLGAKRNIYNVMNECEGEYIACLEGDDYWTDDCKLQKQIDFMDANKEYVEISHQCSVVDQNSDIIRPEAWGFCYQNEYDINILSLFQLPGQSSTLILRNLNEEFNKAVKKIGKIKYCPLDRIMPIFMLSKGKIYCMEDNMSAYRYIVSETATNCSSKHDLKKTKNYFSFCLMMREQETIAKKLGLNLNCSYMKTVFWGKALYSAKHEKYFKCYRMCLLMLLMSKHKRSFIRQGVEIYHKELKYNTT